MSEHDGTKKSEEGVRARYWRTTEGGRLVATGVGHGAFSRNLRDTDNARFTPITEYSLERVGADTRTFKYSEGAEGWLAWATVYRVEGDRLLQYTFIQEDRSPWSSTVSVVLDALVAEAG